MSLFDSSRSAEKTGRGDWKTARVRSHHRFSGLCSGAGCASALTPSGYRRPGTDDSFVRRSVDARGRAAWIPRCVLVGRWAKLSVERRTQMGVGVPDRESPAGPRPRITILPATPLGRWAAGLAASFLALVLVGVHVPRGGSLAVVCGVAGGVAALVAVIRDHERAVTVFAALLPLAFALGFVVAELIGSGP
jgi:hypothetical protein